MEYQHLRPFFRWLIDYRLKWLAIILSVPLILLVSMGVGIYTGTKTAWECLQEVPALARIKRPIK